MSMSKDIESIKVTMQQYEHIIYKEDYAKMHDSLIQLNKKIERLQLAHMGLLDDYKDISEAYKHETRHWTLPELTAD